jgi:hypothetical protein
MNPWGWIVIAWIVVPISAAGIVWLAAKIREDRTKNDARAACHWHCYIHGAIPDLEVGDTGAGTPPFHLGCGQGVRLTTGAQPREDQLPPAWRTPVAPGRPVPPTQ